MNNAHSASTPIISRPPTNNHHHPPHTSLGFPNRDGKPSSSTTRLGTSMTTNYFEPAKIDFCSLLMYAQTHNMSGNSFHTPMQKVDGHLYNGAEKSLNTGSSFPVFNDVLNPTSSSFRQGQTKQPVFNDGGKRKNLRGGSGALNHHHSFTQAGAGGDKRGDNNNNNNYSHNKAPQGSFSAHAGFRGVENENPRNFPLIVPINVALLHQFHVSDEDISSFSWSSGEKMKNSSAVRGGSNSSGYGHHHEHSHTMSTMKGGCIPLAHTRSSEMDNNNNNNNNNNTSTIHHYQDEKSDEKSVDTMSTNVSDGYSTGVTFCGGEAALFPGKQEEEKSTKVSLFDAALRDIGSSFFEHHRDFHDPTHIHSNALGHSYHHHHHHHHHHHNPNGQMSPGAYSPSGDEDTSTVDSFGELLAEALPQAVISSPRSGGNEVVGKNHFEHNEENGDAHNLDSGNTGDDAMLTDTNGSFRSQDAITTLMVRNVPNRYTQQDLLDEINRLGFQGKYDFLYLPLDVRNRCNVGYAFVNFRSAETAAQFVKAFDKRPFRNQKRRIATCRPAHLQGVEANWEHCSKLANANAILLTPEGTVKSMTSDWSMWDSPLHLAPLPAVAV